MLARPESKLQGSQTISYKANFLQRENMHLADHKKEKLSKYLGENEDQTLICTLNDQK